MVLMQLDVSNALLLYGDLQERIYLTQPPSFEDLSRANHKVLHGLKQDPKVWYMNFSTDIQQMGSQQFPYFLIFSSPRY